MRKSSPFIFTIKCNTAAAHRSVSYLKFLISEFGHLLLKSLPCVHIFLLSNNNIVISALCCRFSKPLHCAQGCKGYFRGEKDFCTFPLTLLGSYYANRGMLTLETVAIIFKFWSGRCQLRSPRTKRLSLSDSDVPILSNFLTVLIRIRPVQFIAAKVEADWIVCWKTMRINSEKCNAQADIVNKTLISFDQLLFFWITNSAICVFRRKNTNYTVR